MFAFLCVEKQGYFYKKKKKKKSLNVMILWEENDVKFSRSFASLIFEINTL